MKLIFTAFILLTSAITVAQSDVDKLTTTLKEFHQALVKKNTISINQQTDKALSYGHSNGWVESKADMIKDLETGYISYQDFKEDSLSITLNDNLANARFIAEISATLNGKSVVNHLRVLEVWVKKSNRWLLFARQAIKIL